MENVYSHYVRRPSLRFLQKGMDKRQKLEENRRSARLSKLLAFRQIENLEQVECEVEDSPDEVHKEEHNVKEIPEAGPQLQNNCKRTKSEKAAPQIKPADTHSANLERWKAEKARRKAEQLKKKKPFVSSARPKYEPPVFLLSGPISFEKHGAKAVSAPCIWKGTFPARNPIPDQPSVAVKSKSRTKTTAPAKSGIASKDFEEEICIIKSSTKKVSFAPSNFEFKFKAALISKTKSAARDIINRPVIGGASNAIRRSKRILSKATSLKESADCTFTVPFPVTPIKTATHENEVSLLYSPGGRFSNANEVYGDLMNFSP